VLRLLEGVPSGGDAAAIGLAFQSVALLASDYASALPPPLLRKCLQVAALYGGQQVGCRAFQGFLLVQAESGRVLLKEGEYVNALPPPLLRKCLQVAALYGGQQVGRPWGSPEPLGMLMLVAHCRP
jgi:hypothetical protein